MRVKLDRSLCVGHGRCYELAPDVYAEDERGHCLVRRERIAPEHESQARLGAGNCPERALQIEDDA